MVFGFYTKILVVCGIMIHSTLDAYDVIIPHKMKWRLETSLHRHVQLF